MDPSRAREVLLQAPVCCPAVSWFEGPRGWDLKTLNGELEHWRGPCGPAVTLTPLSAAEDVHLVEVRGRIARREAWIAAWPEGWRALQRDLAAIRDRALCRRRIRAYLAAVDWVPLYRWAPLSEPDPGEFREGRECPRVVTPRRVGDLPAPTSAPAPDGRAGGVGPAPPALNATVRRLLLEADLAARERDRRRGQCRRRRR